MDTSTSFNCQNMDTSTPTPWRSLLLLLLFILKLVLILLFFLKLTGEEMGRNVTKQGRGVSNVVRVVILPGGSRAPGLPPLGVFLPNPRECKYGSKDKNGNKNWREGRQDQEDITKEFKTWNYGATQGGQVDLLSCFYCYFCFFYCYFTASGATSAAHISTALAATSAAPLEMGIWRHAVSAYFSHCYFLLFCRQIYNFFHLLCNLCSLLHDNQRFLHICCVQIFQAQWWVGVFLKAFSISVHHCCFYCSYWYFCYLYCCCCFFCCCFLCCSYCYACCFYCYFCCS